MRAEDQDGARPTLRDLLRTAGERDPECRGVPLLLAVTVLVETLAALAEARRRGVGLGPLALDRIEVRAASLEALLDDPTRDPKIEIARRAGSAAAPPDLFGAGVVFHQLLTGREPRQTPSTTALTGLPAPARRLLDGLLADRPEERPALEEALAEGRALGLELLGAWDDLRRRRRLERELRQALESRSETAVRRLTERLAAVDPAAPWVERARRWLEVRARKGREEAAARHRLAAALYRGHRRDVELCQLELAALLGADAVDDGDLAVSRVWIRRQAARERRRREEARRASLKLALTGAPLALAAFLTGLLAVVMWFSG